MKILRIILITLVLLTFTLPCMAEQSEDKEAQILDAVKEMRKWIEKLDDVKSTIKDADSLYVVSEMIDEMNLSQSVMYNSILADVSIPEKQQSTDLPAYSWSSLGDEGYGEFVELQSDMVEADSGLLYACGLAYHDLYCRIVLSTYDPDCNELLQVRMEIAEKDEEILFTMMLYNVQMDYVARIATWLSDHSAKTVHTQVFGSQMDIRLKPKEWCEGNQQIEEFNKNMLIPVA